MWRTLRHMDVNRQSGLLLMFALQLPPTELRVTGVTGPFVVYVTIIVNLKYSGTSLLVLTHLVSERSQGINC